MAWQQRLTSHIPCPPRVSWGLCSIWSLRDPGWWRLYHLNARLPHLLWQGMRGWDGYAPALESFRLEVIDVASTQNTWPTITRGLGSEGVHVDIPWAVSIPVNMHHLIGASQPQEIYYYSFLQRKKQRHREVMRFAPSVKCKPRAEMWAQAGKLQNTLNCFAAYSSQNSTKFPFIAKHHAN